MLPDPIYPSLSRRRFLQSATAASLAASLPGCRSPLLAPPTRGRPNLLYVFSDQWRFCDHGYTGNPDVLTPHIDRLATQSINFTHAVSGMPVCCPHRASLITGKYPLTHGHFLNDLSLAPTHRSIAHCLNDAGYTTGWIGKWHLDGQGRESFTPPDRRQGFRYWRTLECSHDYHHSFYYGDSPERKEWPGYDSIAQTANACEFLEAHANAAEPFALFLSWGPPHAPYHTAPDRFRDLYAGRDLTLRPNVPTTSSEVTVKDYRGYYAHMTALDACVGQLLDTLQRTGLADNTIVVYTSDHGDMLHSRGAVKKQQPWDESLRIPFLLRWPAKLQNRARMIDLPLDTPDIMPTLLGLTDVPIPAEVEGIDRSGVILGRVAPDPDHAALMSCVSPFGQWSRAVGGREYRGVRTRRYTYCRDLNGPWLLYDNEQDPAQLENRIGDPAFSAIQAELDTILNRRLAETGDEFLPGPEYIARCGYVVNPANDTVDYRQPFDPANVSRDARRARV